MAAFCGSIAPVSSTASCGSNLFSSFASPSAYRLLFDILDDCLESTSAATTGTVEPYLPGALVNALTAPLMDMLRPSRIDLKDDCLEIIGESG